MPNKGEACETCVHVEKSEAELPCSLCWDDRLWVLFRQPRPAAAQGATQGASAHDNYAALRGVFDRAYDQATAGKGAERHATGQAFTNQPMQTISDLVGGNHGCLFQAIKKCQESTRLPKDRAVNKLLGAINYLAGAIIFLEKRK